jgi:thiamine-monophosphate kinase
MTNGTFMLGELGERRIVDELIAPRFHSSPPILLGIGDDGAVIMPPPGELIVVTTDPCPTPVVCMLEGEDFAHYGRMTALINVSDLGAMGARPLGLLVSTVMREDMPTSKYERFLDSLAEACSEWGCPVIGGNIKDGTCFTATGMAIGAVKPDCLMRRTGSQEGDSVVVIGDLGLFWAAVLTRLFPDACPAFPERDVLDKALYQPEPKGRQGVALGEAHLLSACMDSSDGVFACLREISLLNGVDIVVDASSLRVHSAVLSVAHSTKIDPEKLALAWGDWQLVGTASRSSCLELERVLRPFGTPYHIIGKVQCGSGKVWLRTEAGQLGVVSNLASERFSRASMFTHGLDGYVEILRTAPLCTFE